MQKVEVQIRNWYEFNVRRYAYNDEECYGECDVRCACVALKCVFLKIRYASVVFFVDCLPGRYLLFTMLLTIPGITAWTRIIRPSTSMARPSQHPPPRCTCSQRDISVNCDGQLQDRTHDSRLQRRTEPQSYYVVSEIRQRNDFICVGHDTRNDTVSWTLDSLLSPTMKSLSH